MRLETFSNHSFTSKKIVSPSDIPPFSNVGNNNGVYINDSPVTSAGSLEWEPY